MTIGTTLWKAKSRLASAAGHLGGYALARALTGDSPRILMYHRFACESSSKALGVDEFEYQVRQVVRYFRPKTLKQLAAELESSRGVEPRSVVITVDDGYADFHQFALPILQRHKVPATLFVTTDFVDQRIWLWPDLIEFALEHAVVNSVRVNVLAGCLELDMRSEDSRKEAWRDLVRISLGLPDDEMRALHTQLLDRCGVILPAIPTDRYSPLSWEQIRLADEQGIEIGAHTRTHPALSRVPAHRLEDEIVGSKRRIEEMLGHEIVSFCYPNGTPDDVTEEVKRTVAAAGFRAAPVAYFDENVTTDPYELRRYAVDSWRRKFLQSLHGVNLLIGQTRTPASQPVADGR